MRTCRVLESRRAATLTEILVALGLIVFVTAIAYRLFEAGKQAAVELQQETKAAIAKVEKPKVWKRPQRNATSTTVLTLPTPTHPLPTLTPPPAPPGSPPETQPPAENPPPPKVEPVEPMLPTASAPRTLEVPYRKRRSPLQSTRHHRPRPVMLASLAPVYLGVQQLVASTTMATLGGDNDRVWKTYTASEAFMLESRPGANLTIYMDFFPQDITGTQWNVLWNGGANNAMKAPGWSMPTEVGGSGTPGTLNDFEKSVIITMWRMVAEDFAPFEVNVTTKAPADEDLKYTGSTDTKWGVRVLIGGEPTTTSGSEVSNPPRDGNGDLAWPGGIASRPSFKDVTSLPTTKSICWVFNGNDSPNPEDSLPETVSHEVGHTLGLCHDGTTGDPCASGDSYFEGHGTGALSWGPIMGAPHNFFDGPAQGAKITQFSKNEYNGANNSQDDFGVIISDPASWTYGDDQKSGLAFRTDDFGDDIGSATALNADNGGTLTTTYGVIGKKYANSVVSADVDYFKFQANAGTINITIDSMWNPISDEIGDNIGANLDVKAELYNAAGSLLAVSDLDNDTKANFLGTTLDSKGTYYLKIYGTGHGDPKTNGYSSYGSVGNYRITGTVPPYTPPLPPNLVRVRNPLIWIHDKASKTTWGYITITNSTSTALNGFDLELTLPFDDLAIAKFHDKQTGGMGGGMQRGKIFSITLSNNLMPGQPQQFFVSVQNPTMRALPVGQDGFTAQIAQASTP